MKSLRLSWLFDSHAGNAICKSHRLAEALSVVPVIAEMIRPTAPFADESARKQVRHLKRYSVWPGSHSQREFYPCDLANGPDNLS